MNESSRHSEAKGRCSEKNKPPCLTTLPARGGCGAEGCEQWRGTVRTGVNVTTTLDSDL